jgi:hypothetical protein
MPFYEFYLCLLVNISDLLTFNVTDEGHNSNIIMCINLDI